MDIAAHNLLHCPSQIQLRTNKFWIGTSQPAGLRFEGCGVFQKLFPETFSEAKNVPKNERKGLTLLPRATHDGLFQAQFQTGEHTLGDETSHDSYVEVDVWWCCLVQARTRYERLASLEWQMTPEELAEAQERLAKCQQHPRVAR